MHPGRRGRRLAAIDMEFPFASSICRVDSRVWKVLLFLRVSLKCVARTAQQGQSWRGELLRFVGRDVNARRQTRALNSGQTGLRWPFNHYQCAHTFDTACCFFSVYVGFVHVYEWILIRSARLLYIVAKSLAQSGGGTNSHARGPGVWLPQVCALDWVCFGRRPYIYRVDKWCTSKGLCAYNVYISVYILINHERLQSKSNGCLWVSLKSAKVFESVSCAFTEFEIHTLMDSLKIHKSCATKRGAFLVRVLGSSRVETVRLEDIENRDVQLNDCLFVLLVERWS